MSEAVVCGFSDPAVEIAGLAWSLDGAEGGLLLANGEVHAAAARVVESGDVTEVSLETPIAGCEAKLSPRGAPSPLLVGGEDALRAEAASVTAEFELLRGGASGSKQSDGHLTRWSQSPVAGASVLRHLAMPGPDGSLLLVIAVRPEGASEQDEELAGAWGLSANGESAPFGEALLSTEYDAAGRPTRAGLELWPEDPDGPPMRAAATRLGGIGEERIAAALTGSTVEGAEGIGSYLLWRAD